METLYVNDTHQLDVAEQKGSPNFDLRPDIADISLLVLHNITLPVGDVRTDFIDALFCNVLDCSLHPCLAELEDVRVSPHLLICRDGRIFQYVAFDKRAWHAGISVWNGRHGCNDFSIGIELQGTDSQAYETVQYEVLAEVVAALFKRYPRIVRSHIVGHQEIAPGRKTDPGKYFDWGRFLSSI